MTDNDKSEKILVIEDDECIRDALRELLEIEGYDVLLAEHGQSALNLLKDDGNIPGLILLDLTMPVMDGATFLKEIVKQFPVHKNIPIITMTAAGPAEIPEGLLTNEVLRKPLEVDLLMSRIESTLAKAAAG